MKTEQAAMPIASHFSANHLGWDAIIKWAYSNSGDGVMAVRDIAKEFVDWRTRANAAEAALRAGERMRKNEYRSWETSGGPNECAHGMAEGIDCRRCDEEIWRAAVT